MPYHFYEYLEFNSDEDRENQLEVYVAVELSAETEERVKALGVQGEWLVMGEPFCPDCVEFVAYLQRIAKLNPNINVRYVSRKDNKELKHFDNAEQQKLLVETHNIPSLFRIENGETKLVLKEFPAFFQAKLAAEPEKRSELIADYRMGKFGKEVEKELVEILTS